LQGGYLAFAQSSSGGGDGTHEQYGLPTLECKEEDGNTCSANYGVDGGATAMFASACLEAGGHPIEKSVLCDFTAGVASDEIALTIRRRDCMAWRCSEAEFCAKLELGSDPIVLTEEIFVESFEVEYECRPKV
jgi:hypothetical protein